VYHGDAQQNCSEVGKQLVALPVFPFERHGRDCELLPPRGGRTTEEYMRSTKFTLSMAALALGGLLSVPALAQMPDTQTNNTQNYKYPTGRSMNDGGYQVQQESSGPAAPQYNLSPQYQRRAQRTAAGGQGQPPSAYRYVGENAGVSDTGYGGGWNQSWNQPWGEPQRQYYDYNTGWNGGGFGVAPVPMAVADNSACAARFRSFDPATGTYLGLDGRRHICR
jgi:BA14K-like protein